MRTVAQFYQESLRGASLQPPLDLLLDDAAGCVLAEDVIAPFDHPTAAVATCDGYAVIAADLEQIPFSGTLRLPVLAEVRSGDANPGSLVPKTSVRIASGGRLPQGADAVVPLAQTDMGVAEVQIWNPVGAGANISAGGADFERGQVVLQNGTRLGPQQIAALAAVGKSRVVVHPRPRVVILSVGDELVEPGTTTTGPDVFDVNGHSLASAAAEAGAEAYRTQPMPDDPIVFRQALEDQMMRADLLITTGGLSFGSDNTVREVLDSVDTVRFEEVAAEPASMMGVGTVGEEGERQVPIICLPGNPVAALIGFEVYVRPVLRKMMGWTKVNRPAVRAAVDTELTSPPGKREFLRVRLSGNPEQGYWAELLGDPKKLWLSALAESNAIAVVPEDVTTVPAGEQLTCMLLD